MCMFVCLCMCVWQRSMSADFHYLSRRSLAEPGTHNCLGCCMDISRAVVQRLCSGHQLSCSKPISGITFVSFLMYPDRAVKRVCQRLFFTKLLFRRTMLACCQLALGLVMMCFCCRSIGLARALPCPSLQNITLCGLHSPLE